MSNPALPSPSRLELLTSGPLPPLYARAATGVRTPLQVVLEAWTGDGWAPVAHLQQTFPLTCERPLTGADRSVLDGTVDQLVERHAAQFAHVRALFVPADVDPFDVEATRSGVLHLRFPVCAVCGQTALSPHNTHVDLRVAVEERVAPRTWVRIATLVRPFEVPSYSPQQPPDAHLVAVDVLAAYSLDPTADEPLAVSGRPVRAMVLPADPVDGDTASAALAIAGGEYSIEDDQRDPTSPALAGQPGHCRDCGDPDPDGSHGLHVNARVVVEVRRGGAWQRVASVVRPVLYRFHFQEPEAVWGPVVRAALAAEVRSPGPDVRVMVLPHSRLGGGGPDDALYALGGDQAAVGTPPGSPEAVPHVVVPAEGPAGPFFTPAVRVGGEALGAGLHDTAELARSAGQGLAALYASLQLGDVIELVPLAAAEHAAVAAMREMGEMGEVA